MNSESSSWQNAAFVRAAIGIVGISLAYPVLGLLLGFTDRTLEYLALASIAVWTAVPVGTRDDYKKALAEGHLVEDKGLEAKRWSAALVVFFSLFMGSRQGSVVATLPWWVIAGVSWSYFASVLVIEAMNAAHEVGRSLK